MNLKEMEENVNQQERNFHVHQLAQWSLRLKPSLKTIIIITLCRFIPFETFLCIATAAHGWHNSLSNTIVLPDSEV